MFYIGKWIRPVIPWTTYACLPDMSVHFVGCERQPDMEDIAVPDIQQFQRWDIG